MEHYVKSKFKTIRYDAKCKIKANQCINHAKIISDNNIKTFILNLNNSKNRVCDVDKTLNFLEKDLNNGYITNEEKLILFYYTYKYNKILLNNKVIDSSKNLVIIDIEQIEPNLYIGYINEKAYYLRIVLNNDELNMKKFILYNLMEMKKITHPEILLTFKVNQNNTILIEKYEKITVNDDKTEIFIDILNILFQLNKNGIFVNFDIDNIVKIHNKHQKYYLMDIDKYKLHQRSINVKKQISYLLISLDMDLDLKSMKNSLEIYQFLIKKYLFKIDI